MLTAVICLAGAAMLPFVILAAAAWVDPEVLGQSLEGELFGPAVGVSGLLLHILSVHALSVLGFGAGIRWARASAHGEAGPSPVRAGAAVLPPLLAWLIVSLVDLPRAFWWLAGSFVLATALDYLLPAGGRDERAGRDGRERPPTGGSPRPGPTPLTIVAIASLCVAALAG